MSMDVDRMWKWGGWGQQQLLWCNSTVSATSVYLKIPLLICEADELFVGQLSQSLDRSGFSRVSSESTKEREHWGRWCTCRALCVCPHGWAQSAQPMGGKKRGSGGFQSRCWEQRVGGAGWQESEKYPPPFLPFCFFFKTKKSVPVTLFLNYLLTTKSSKVAWLH